MEIFVVDGNGRRRSSSDLPTAIPSPLTASSVANASRLHLVPAPTERDADIGRQATLLLAVVLPPRADAVSGAEDLHQREVDGEPPIRRAERQGDHHRHVEPDGREATLFLRSAVTRGALSRERESRDRISLRSWTTGRFRVEPH